MVSVSPIQRVLFYLPALVLAVWGTVMIHVVVSGRIALLLAPIFRPFVLIAGVLLVLLAAGHVLYFQPAPPPRRRRGAVSVKEPALTFEAMRWLVLLAPIVVAAALAPSRYSENILLARGVQTAPMGGFDANDQRFVEEIEALLAAHPRDEPLDLTLYDVIALSAVPRAAEVLGAHAVRLDGQFSPGDATVFRLVDIMVFCCAADAVPMGVTVYGEVPGDLVPMDWLSVTGPLRFESKLGRHVVALDAIEIERIPPPDDVFLP